MEKLKYLLSLKGEIVGLRSTESEPALLKCRFGEVFSAELVPLAGEGFSLPKREPVVLQFPLGIRAVSDRAGEEALLRAVRSVEMQAANSAEPLFSGEGIPVGPLEIGPGGSCLCRPDGGAALPLAGPALPLRALSFFRGIDGVSYEEKYALKISEWKIETKCRNGAPWIFVRFSSVEVAEKEAGGWLQKAAS